MKAPLLAKSRLLFCIFTLSVFGLFACQSSEEPQNKDSAQSSSPLPFSDQSNSAGWVLNTELSDEFIGDKLDEKRWFIEGQHGDYYIWKGRAPSQFIPENVRVEEGKLKLRTAWQPDYPFIKETYADGGMGVAEYGKTKDGVTMPITTAGVVSKKRFLHGYMEVKSKTGKAAITGAFWALGFEQELDVFEQMGAPKKEEKIRANTSLSTAHDWSPPATRPTHVFNHIEPLAWNTADEFHVYGAEWGIDYLKLFIDGKEVHHFTQDDVGNDWILNNPMEIWLDSEIFYWLGYPHKEELPVDFEIEYMRVWQKPMTNLLAPAFFGFEGPKLYQENPRPLRLGPTKPTDKNYQQFWYIDNKSAEYLSIIEGEYATGVNSLQFRHIDKTEKVDFGVIKALSPKGALTIPAGDFTLKIKVFLDQGRIADKITIKLHDPEQMIEFSGLSSMKRREWLILEQTINRSEASSKTDQLSVEFNQQDIAQTRNKARVLIDDIEIHPLLK